MTDIERCARRLEELARVYDSINDRQSTSHMNIILTSKAEALYEGARALRALPAATDLPPTET